MREPAPIDVAEEGVIERGIDGARERRQVLGHVVDRLDQAILARRVAGGMPGDDVGSERRKQPGHVEPQRGRTAFADPGVVEVGRGHDRGDRPEMWRRGGRGHPLRVADVRAADHPDLAVRPRLGGRPFDGVVAVVGLVDERLELAIRCESTARVLEHEDVPAAVARNGSGVIPTETGRDLS